MPSLPSHRLVLLLLGLCIACSGASAPTPPPDLPTPPTPPTPPAPPSAVATQLTFTLSPAEVRTAAVFAAAPTVEVRDAAGARVAASTASVTVTLVGGTAGATLRGTTTVAAVNGVATFPGLSVDSAGTGYTFTATATGLSSATSAVFAVRRGTPNLAFRTQPVSGQAGTPFTTQPVIEIRDSVTGGILRNRQDTVTLTLGTNASGGQLTGERIAIANAGVATFVGLGVSAPGTGYVLTASAPGTLPAASLPFAAAGAPEGLFLTLVDGGSSINCGVQVQGGAFCWGNGTSGALGNGPTANPGSQRTRPVPVSGTRLAQLSVGHLSACGLTIEGAARCWGDNGRGQLGNGNSQNASAPVDVAGGRAYRRIAVGRFHACAIRTINDETYCWGANDRGQAGLGFTSSEVLQPALVVRGNSVFTEIAVGTDFTCALAQGGQLFCWGQNADFQLGNGIAGDRNLPTAVPFPIPAAAIRSVSVGETHGCAIDVNNLLFCWGNNDFGQLGDGTTTEARRPRQIDATARYLQVSVGTTHTCAIRTDNTAVCWGRNNEGVLGDGTSTLRLTPVVVSGGRRWTTIAASQFNTCGIEQGTQRTFCWGSTLNGAVGNGVASVSGSERLPVPVLSPQP